MTDAPLLTVEDLEVTFRTEDGLVHAVDGVSFALKPGEVLAIVGESGSGKSVTSMTLMGLTRSPNARFGGSAKLRGQELVTASDDELRRVRGKEIAMIFQDPMTSLNPVHRIGAQIVEQIQAHEDVSDADARDRVVALLERVGTVIRVPEALIGVAGAVSGVGPAYVALVTEAWADAAVRHGLPAATATELVTGTLAGAAELLRDGDTLSMRRAVTSPGGTTARGLAALEREGLRRAFAAAMDDVVGVA